jgi:hypothetical protein
MSDFIHIKRDDCRLCGSRNLKAVIELKPSALADSYLKDQDSARNLDKYPLDFYLCKKCGHTQLLDVINPEVIYRDYLYATTSSLGLVDHFRGYADYVIKYTLIEERQLVLDIGSNDGSLLRAFQAKKMRVLGVDPAIEIAKQATGNGIETLPEFFNAKLAQQLREKYGPAKVITINNLLANIDAMDDIFEGITQMLDAEGVFIVEFAYVGDLLRNMVFDYIYHEHLSYFSIKPITTFIAKFGLELIDAQPQPTKGGSLRLIYQRKGGAREVSSSVSRMITEEEKLRLDDEDMYRDYCSRIDTCKAELHGLLEKEKSKGKIIAGYGASATTTTLVHHYDLGDYLDFIVDDFDAKQNTFAPGTGIPVYGPEALYEKKPDYVVVLAWRYVDPIAAKHQAYFDQGGKFVVPLPEFSINPQ